MGIQAEKLWGRHQTQGEATASCTCRKPVEACIEADATATTRVRCGAGIRNNTCFHLK